MARSAAHVREGSEAPTRRAVADPQEVAEARGGGGAMVGNRVSSRYRSGGVVVVVLQARGEDRGRHQRVVFGEVSAVEERWAAPPSYGGGGRRIHVCGGFMARDEHNE